MSVDDDDDDNDDVVMMIIKVMEMQRNEMKQRNAKKQSRRTRAHFGLVLLTNSSATRYHA